MMHPELLMYAIWHNQLTVPIIQNCPWPLARKVLNNHLREAYNVHLLLTVSEVLFIILEDVVHMEVFLLFH